MRARLIGLTLTATLAVTGCASAESGPGTSPTPAVATTGEPFETPDALPSSAAPASSVDTVYYQPRTSDLQDPESQELPDGVFRMFAEPDVQNTWTIGNCQGENADNFTETQSGIDTLVGFSLGRIGVDYYLTTAPAAEQAEIASIIIVAPGNTEDFTDSCDHPSVDDALATWLQTGDDKRLTIIADNRTAEAGFAGIDKLYLETLAATAVADQVTLCVSGRGHEDTWNIVKPKVLTSPLEANCPPETIKDDSWR